MNATTKTLILNEVDVHNRNKQLLHNIAGLEDANPSKEILQAYNTMLEREFLKEKLSVSGWQKNIFEAKAFCKFFSKPASELTKKDIEAWWEHQEDRLITKDITDWTLRKYHSMARKFLRFALGKNKKEYLEVFDWIELENKPRNTMLASELPSQEEMKTLIEASYVEGKKCSLRNQAIIALCNDVGCRISEALALRNKDIQPQQNYLVVSFPKSKTKPRTVICFLAKQYLESWAKVSPNKDKGSTSECAFFCRKDGLPAKYAVVLKGLKNALQKTKIVFPKNKKTHFFRKLFASRAYAWSKVQRDYWLGWSGGISDTYTSIDWHACTEPYFAMLKAEQNPMLNAETAFWDEKTISEQVLEKLIQEKPEFKMLLRQLVRETMKNQ